MWAFHSGQICTAPTRVLAQRGIYDQLVAGLQAAAGRLTVGDPLAPDTVVGPVISAAQRDRIEAHVRAGVDEGGTLVAGGERPDVGPRLLRGAHAASPTAKPGMRVVQEEIFGPVVVVLPFDDEDEGVALANGTDFGLNDYVFTGDTARGLRVARQLRSGSVGHQHRPAEPGGRLRRVQAVRRRPRPGQLRPPRLQRAAVDRVAGLSGTGERHEGHRLDRASSRCATTSPCATPGRTRCGCASPTPGCATATCR